MKQSQNLEKTLSEEEKSFLALRETLAYVARELARLPNAPAAAAKGVNEAFTALNVVLGSSATASADENQPHRLN